MSMRPLLALPRDPALPFTRDELLAEVRDTWAGLSAEIGGLMGWGTLDGGVLATRSDYLARCAGIWHDYALSGVWPDLPPGPLDDSLAALTKFAALARPLAELAGGVNRPERCALVILVAGLRARLDYLTLGRYPEAGPILDAFVEAADHFTLGEVAQLAHMNEKSVRNATQPGKEDRLLTRKAGDRTVVDAAELARWLGSRRRFQATRLPAS